MLKNLHELITNNGKLLHISVFCVSFSLSLHPVKKTIDLKKREGCVLTFGTYCIFESGFTPNNTKKLKLVQNNTKKVLISVSKISAPGWKNSTIPQLIFPNF